MERRKRALLIYNPTAGRETAKSFLQIIMTELEAGGFELDAHATEGPGDAMHKAASAAGEYETVIAVGGDGTLHEIVNGLHSAPGEGHLGIIPRGTSNDFARALGLPMDVRAACKVIIGGRAQRVDLGKINDRFFINIAGGGSLTNISYEVPSKLKTYLGQLAYYARSLEELPRLKAMRMHFQAPGLDMEDDIMLFLTANSRAVGGFNYLAPNASLADGKLDVVIIRSLNLAEFIQLAAKGFTGDHINHPKVTYFQTTSLHVSGEEKIPLNADGEYAGVSPCSITVQPRSLKICVP